MVCKSQQQCSIVCFMFCFVFNIDSLGSVPAPLHTLHDGKVTQDHMQYLGLHKQFLTYTLIICIWKGGGEKIQAKKIPLRLELTVTLLLECFPGYLRDRARLVALLGLFLRSISIRPSWSPGTSLVDMYAGKNVQAPNAERDFTEVLGMTPLLCACHILWAKLEHNLLSRVFKGLSFAK